MHNPIAKADYATVHFSFVPPANSPYPDKDIYLIGQLNDYNLFPEARMNYNADKGVYETDLFLKQGYYDYMYVTKNKSGPKKPASFEPTEGNLWETENQYLILVYYRELAGRADQLIGLTRLNSLTGK